MEWMILPYRRYADFSGRSRRREYWMFVLFFYLVVIGGTLLINLVDDGVGGGNRDPGPVALAWWALYAGFVMVSIIPAVAVSVRRFHDQDMSGWWFLLVLIPSIGILLVLIFMALRGTRGDNRFGPDPLADSTAAEVFS